MNYPTLRAALLLKAPAYEGRLIIRGMGSNAPIIAKRSHGGARVNSSKLLKLRVICSKTLVFVTDRIMHILCLSQPNGAYWPCSSAQKKAQLRVKVRYGFFRCQIFFRLDAVLIHCSDQIINAIKVLFAAQILGDRNFKFVTIDLTFEVKDVRFEQRLAIIKHGAATIASNAS